MGAQRRERESREPDHPDHRAERKELGGSARVLNTGESDVVEAWRDSFESEPDSPKCAELERAKILELLERAKDTRVLKPQRSISKSRQLG